ncbi:MAG: hypothetical protein K2X29_10650 [Candidatus Obscuribacterales bacterium]|nr:hypothetical protein [Candidatus Obscuribacterales bacterium]
MADTLREYKNLIVAYLRDFESSRAAGDPEKLRRLSETPDDLLLKKWAIFQLIPNDFWRLIMS